MQQQPNKTLATEPVAYSSNCIRLSAAQWAVAAVLIAAALLIGPRVLHQRGRFDAIDDYRLGSQSSDDYWLFQQWCSSARQDYDCLVIGDSAIRGYYVPRDQTLSAYLDELSPTHSFANLGADGMHPAALAGLLRYYGSTIRGKKVLLHMNPLWMSSKSRDLQSEKEQQFHHQKLVPQFGGRINCYKAKWPERVSTSVSRRVNWLNWASHLRVQWFESRDLANWTLDHPYEFPKPIAADEIPAKDQRRPWSEMGVRPQDMPFVEPHGSVQWSFFKEAVELLRDRDNQVFVIIGPFNEHMLTGDSVTEYAAIKQTVQTWLTDNGISHCVMTVLESDLYRDASHPLAAGYEAMARQLLADDGFAELLAAD